MRDWVAIAADVGLNLSCLFVHFMPSLFAAQSSDLFFG